MSNPTNDPSFFTMVTLLTPPTFKTATDDFLINFFVILAWNIGTRGAPSPPLLISLSLKSETTFILNSFASFSELIYCHDYRVFFYTSFF